MMLNDVFVISSTIDKPSNFIIFNIGIIDQIFLPALYKRNAVETKLFMLMSLVHVLEISQLFAPKAELVTKF